MSFDDYFDLDDSMSRDDQLVSFLVGLAPRATHRPYTDFSSVNLRSGAGPFGGAGLPDLRGGGGGGGPQDPPGPVADPPGPLVFPVRRLPSEAGQGAAPLGKPPSLASAEADACQVGADEDGRVPGRTQGRRLTSGADLFRGILGWSRRSSRSWPSHRSPLRATTPSRSASPWTLRAGRSRWAWTRRATPRR